MTEEQSATKPKLELNRVPYKQKSPVKMQQVEKENQAQFIHLEIA